MLTILLPQSGPNGIDIILTAADEGEIARARAGLPAKGIVKRPIPGSGARIYKEEEILLVGTKDLVALDKELRFLISSGRAPREQFQEIVMKYAIEIR